MNIWCAPQAWEKLSDAVGKYWWAILAVTVLLVVVLFLVISAKNKRIRKLKKELKQTRSDLEIERSRAKNEEMFAPVTGSTKIFGSEPEHPAANEPAADEPAATAKEQDDDIETVEEEDTEHAAGEKHIAYYDNASVVGQKGGNVRFRVKYDRKKDSWVITKDGVNRVVRRVDTKEEALGIARALCRKYNGSMVVHKKDGKFQRQ